MSDQTWPHGFWAFSSLGSCLALIAWLFIVSVRSLAPKQQDQRLAPVSIVGWFLLGISPLSCFGAHLWEASHRFDLRLPQPSTTTTDIAQIWLASFLDGTARLQHNRTFGQHVTLLHATDEVDPEAMVQKMDGHIETMCAELGALPRGKVAWLRGRSLGLSGVSIGPWAITDQDQPAGKLTPLDRHEVAHSAIRNLCPPHIYPPRLMVEGWAESQSTQRDNEIVRLADVVERGNHFQLDELLEEPYYSASRGPVYQYGCSFTNFLLEQYSGEQFLKLYRNTGPNTYREDVHRILGKAWPELESQFWKWLLEEAKLIRLSRITDHDSTTRVEFARTGDAKIWQELLGHFATTSWQHADPPKHMGLRMEHQTKDGDGKALFSHEVSAIFQGENRWYHHTDTMQNRYAVLLTSDRWAKVQHHRDGVITGTSGDLEGKPEVRETGRYLLNLLLFQEETNPAKVLPFGQETFDLIQRIRVDQIERPDADSTLWHVRCHRWMTQEDENSWEDDVDIWMDGSNQFAIKKLLVQQPSLKSSHEFEVQYEMRGSALLPIRTTGQFRSEGKLTSSFESKMHVLSQERISSVKREVVRMANSLDSFESKTWHDFGPSLVRLLPLLGLAMVVLADWLVPIAFRTRTDVDPGE